MEVKFIDYSEQAFWEVTVQTLLKRGYGIDNSAKFADQLTLERRKRLA